MRALLHWPCSLSSLGTALVLLAGVLLAPMPARAGCGEHVVTVTLLEKTVPSSAPVPLTPPENPRIPCSGPHCTGLPTPPMPMPTAPTGPSGQQWACLLGALLSLATYSAPYAQEGPCERPLFVAASIYHPPR